MRIRTTPALIATAPSPRTSAWLVTCESIAQRLAGQCLEHQPTPTALASTVNTALAPSCTAWVCSVTCAFTRAELTTILTHPPHPTHPPGPAPPSLHRHTRPSPPPPPPQPLPLQLTPTTSTSHAHTAAAPSPHASAWSVTCESIAQRLAKQCLEHQSIPTNLDSTVQTVLALSGTAWVYSVTCTSTRAELTTIPTHPPHPTHPPCPAAPLLHRHTRPSPLPPLQMTPTPPTSHAHTAHARSPHTSAWSVTCESIAQRLANQGLEHQTTPTTLASTTHIVFVLSRIAWAYSATCAFTMTCGKQPPVTPHHNTLLPCLLLLLLLLLLHHHYFTTHQHSPTAVTHLTPPTQVGSPHLDSVPMRLRPHA
nr:unnamed protein product [Spirometra erinaceieuropaei]